MKIIYNETFIELDKNVHHNNGQKKNGYNFYHKINTRFKDLVFVTCITDKVLITKTAPTRPCGSRVPVSKLKLLLEL